MAFFGAFICDFFNEWIGTSRFLVILKQVKKIPCTEKRI